MYNALNYTERERALGPLSSGLNGVGIRCLFPSYEAIGIRPLTGIEAGCASVKFGLARFCVSVKITPPHPTPKKGGGGHYDS